MTKKCKYCSKEYTTHRGITGCPECFVKFLHDSTEGIDKIHKIGAHGAVGIVTKTGLKCSECSKEI